MKTGADDFLAAGGDLDKLPRVDAPEATLTDVGNARRFVAGHGRNVRYSFPWHAWLVWDGTCWRRDETGLVMELAKDTVRAMYGQAAAESSGDERRALAGWAEKSESAVRLDAMLKLAHSEPGVAVRPEELDRDPWLLNCTNGTLDLRTAELRLHRRDDLITKCLAVAYDPSSVCPIFERFLERIFDKQQPLIGFVQRALGYGITGSTREQCFFIAWGAGQNGKSTLTGAVSRVLGPYAVTLDAETLVPRRGDLGLRLNDLSALPGARLATLVEPDLNRRLAEGLIKMLTGGDPIRAKKLYADLFTFENTAKLWLSTNHRPIIRGTDHAIWRRVKLIPFTVTVPDEERDDQLLEKLAAEAVGILAWLVRGCRSWQAGGLGTPELVTRATDSYRAAMDVLGDFLEDSCVLGPTLAIPAADLYEAYVVWARNAGESPITKKALGLALQERGFQPYKSGGRRWRGLGLTISASRLIKDGKPPSSRPDPEDLRNDLDAEE